MRKSLKTKARKKVMLGAVSLLLVMLMVVVACGDAATPTAIPATAEPAAPAATAEPAAPAATARPAAPAATAAPAASAAPVATKAPGQVLVATKAPVAPAPAPSTGGVRPRSEWTEEEPATLAELEAEIETHRGESLTFTSWGGAYQAAQRQAYVVPFEEQFGIEVIEDSPTVYAKIRVMAETANYQWNAIDVGGRALWAEIKADSLQALDMSVVDMRSHVDILREGAPYNGGGGITWSTVLAYNTDTYATPPTTWSDFYDRDRFPGRRGIRDAYRGSWFSAGLHLHPDWFDTAEGRARLGKPTEADVEEYLAFFDGFDFDLFWTTGSDCPQMLISGELDMCTAWNGRIYNAQIEGAPLGIAWGAGHLVGTGTFVMPKGLKEGDPDAYTNAELWIAWTGQPEINATQSKYITYGPSNTKSAPFLEGSDYDAVRDSLPTSAENIQYAVFEHEKHSGEWNDRWNEKWQAYMQSQ